MGPETFLCKTWKHNLEATEPVKRATYWKALIDSIVQIFENRTQKMSTREKVLQQGPTATLPNNEQIQALIQGILPLHLVVKPTALVFLTFVY